MAIFEGTYKGTTNFGNIPSTILGDKLQFHFDNRNLANLTLSGSDVVSQLDQTGNFIRKQDTPGSRPTWANGVISTSGGGNFLTLRTVADGIPSTILDDTQGLWLLIGKINSTADQLNIWASDASATNTWFGVGSDSGELIKVFWQIGGNAVDIKGTGSVADFTYHSLIYTSNGTRYKMYFDGVDQDPLTEADPPNNGNWIGDLSTPDVITFGTLQRAGSDLFYNNDEKQVLYMSEEPTADELSKLFKWAATQI